MNGMTEALSTATLMLWAGISIALTHCPENDTEFNHEADMCMEPSQRTSNITLVGGLTEELWREHCGIYRKSLECLHELENMCVEYDHLQYGEPFRDGIGKLCEDNNTFQVYRHHASCYSRHQAATFQCLVDFKSKIKELSEIIDYADSYFDDSMICSANDNMMACVYNVLRPECGEEASLLYEQLVKAQVPTEMSALCQLLDLPDDYEDEPDSSYPDYQNGGNIITSSWLLFVLVISYSCA